MLTTTLRLLFARDLSRVHQELAAYHDEQNIWRVDKGIANSAGNLALHLIGNLNTYIGAELGGQPYIRNREQEFALQHVPRAQLLHMLQATAATVEQTLQELPPSALAAEYPLLVLAEKTSTEYFLVHLATHLAYHLGQINYHRRLLDS